MDVPADQAASASAPPVHATPREAVRSPRRRRPTGAPPPLPYRLQASGVGWLVAGGAAEPPVLLGFTSREGLRQALGQRSGGRLHLDPGQAR